MSVSEGHTLAALMPIATIPKGLTTVHVNLDSLGVEENARVSITLRMLSKGSGFSNLELSDKQNLRLPYQEQYVKKTSPFIVVFTVVGASIYIYIYIYIYIFFFNDNLFLVICVFFCSDINECARGLYKCNSDAFCNNIKGSYNCICKPGFTGRECKGKRWGRNVVENQLVKSLSKNFDTLAIALLFF